jgi:hydrogenase maturation protease
MNEALVDQIVEAVLYEGYILYPYRPSIKNQQRWTFGGLYPRLFCETYQAGDAWSMQTECLVCGGANTVVHINVRFLHLQERLVGKLAWPAAELERGEEPVCEVVERLKVGNRLIQNWQEAVQREVALPGLYVNSLTCEPLRRDFLFPGSRKIEDVRGAAGEIEAILIRETCSISGRVQVSTVCLGDGVFKLRVRIENLTKPEKAGTMSRDRAVLHALASTHTILSVQDGEFCSLIDPPPEFRAMADSCDNAGTWPVLIGRKGENYTMLSSPITLYDYPQVAAESPGDFFDGTEIDEMLVLRILTLTEEEKQAAAAVDERVRTLLTRTSSLSDEQMMRLHGTVRGLRPANVGESP